MEFKLFKILVLIITAGFFGISIYGNIRVQRESDPMKLLPQDSYIANHIKYRRMYYPNFGELATVYFRRSGNMELLPEYLMEVIRIMEKLERSKRFIRSTHSWHKGFKDFILKEHKVDIANQKLNSTFFHSKLGQYLHSKDGSKFRNNFWFDGQLVCGEDLPRIGLFSSEIRHVFFNSTDDKTQALHFMRESLIEESRSLGGNGDVFAITKDYAAWETDVIISHEMYKNIGTAVICIFLTTMVMLNSFTISLIVMLCVVLTLINVMGFMYFVDITIDMVSCNTIIISVGLCVDFSVHVAHTFLTLDGTRIQRVRRSLEEIGPAVMNGGFSTFLAFSMLIFSQSYVFKSFFKIFSLVVGFGLFNGLLSLPVILSIIGPPSHFPQKPQEVTVSVISPA